MEIGSFFEYPEYDCNNFEESALYALKTCYGLQTQNCLFVRDGRQAIKSVLMANYSNVKNVICYLPAYLCESILQPFKELNLQVKFYPLEHPLKPKINSDIKKSLIFLIDYFGVRSTSPNMLYDLLSNDNIVIMDITHSIFDKQRFKISDENLYLIASLRKVFPIPDGGVVYYINPKFSINLNEPYGYEKMVEAMFLKKYYLQHLNKIQNTQLKFLKELKDYFLKIYKEYESAKDINTISLEKIPQLSLYILSKLLIKKIIIRRKLNLKYLYNFINKSFLLFRYSDIKSPFFLPLLFNNNKERERIRLTLISNGIYTPIHWILPRDIPRRYKYEYMISSRILSVPIDQRYSKLELNVVTEILNRVT